MSDLESQFNSATDFLGVANVGGVVLSGILLFTPVRAMRYIGIRGGLGTFAASVVTREKHARVAKKALNQLVDGYEVELRDRNGEILNLNGTVSDLQRTIQSLQNETTRFQELAEKIESLAAQNQSKDNIIEKVTGELDRCIELARVAVEESLDISENSQKHS